MAHFQSLPRHRRHPRLSRSRLREGNAIGACSPANAALDSHFAAADVSPADVDRWRELKRHITRMRDGLDLARIELDRTSQEAGKALQHVRFGLGEVGSKSSQDEEPAAE